MMTSAKIKGISYYLPEYSLTNEKINDEFPEWGIEKISKKTGISERRICGVNEYASDMAIKVAEQLFKELSLDRTSIDFLLYCTQSPDYFLPSTSCIIQHELGLRKTIGALDFNLGCSGYVYGLSLAKGLIVSAMAKNVLLITSETYSKFIHPKDKSNKTIFGDAASATLISNCDGFCEIGDFVFGTDGSGSNNLIVKNGGLRNYKKQGIDQIDEYGNVRNDNNLYMNGAEILNFTLDEIPILTNAILEKSKLAKSEIDLFIFHQANKYLLDLLRKKIDKPIEKFVYAMESSGNTVSSTIPIAISQSLRQGKLSNIKNCILEGFGVGYSLAACNLKF